MVSSIVMRPGFYILLAAFLGFAFVLAEGATIPQQGYDASHLIGVAIEVALIALLAFIGIRGRMRQLTMQVRQRAGLCPQCGHDWKTTPGTCPVCGFAAEACYTPSNQITPQSPVRQDLKQD